METNKKYQGDALKILKIFPEESIDCVMTSLPYFNQRKSCGLVCFNTKEKDNKV